MLECMPGVCEALGVVYSSTKTKIKDKTEPVKGTSEGGIEGSGGGGVEYE